MAARSEKVAEELLAEAARFAQETLGKADSMRKLAEDVSELLAESEALCPHPRLSAEYAKANAKHAELSGGQLALLEEAGAAYRSFDRTRYEQRVAEATKSIANLKNADAQTLAALGLVVPVLEPTMERVMGQPEQIALAVGAILASPSGLARWHFEVLSLYLDRPSIWERLTGGVGELLKAAMVDASGSVLPFLGTAEVLCQLAVSQMSRDRERISKANEDVSRLYFLNDHLDELARGAETARDNAKRGKEFIVDANRDFDEGSQWLIEAVGVVSHSL